MGWRYLLIGTVLVAFWFASGYVRAFLGRVDLGAGYVAYELCNCVLIGERSIESCRADLLPDVDAFNSEFLPDGKGIRASLLLQTRVAHWEPETGCTLH